MQNKKHGSPFDTLIAQFDRGLKTAAGRAPVSQRNHPAELVDESNLSSIERDRSIRLMRVNHAGEVAAQALYHGQALTAKLDDVREAMEHAASEETDHLAWCAQRIEELGGQPSRLQPLWYAGSFAIGATAGLLGDKWSLGFVAETERQVVNHLTSHESQLPTKDKRSRAIIEKMKADEEEHGQAALDAGGVKFPEPVQQGMAAMSKIMTSVAWWV
jgi:ubiquinone biosynthesis monooxygenase Coq7